MATKRKIKGGEVGSVKKLRSGLKKGGGKGFVSRVPEDGSLTVRFITEPEEWVMFYEHYDSVRKFYPCSDDCPGCDEGDSPSQRYLANALDRDDGKVIPLLMPKNLASSVLKRYDKFKTLLDRDYELTRTGSGFDTEYDSLPEAPTKVNIDRYEPLDLWEIVENQLPDDEDEDDDEDEAPRRRSGGGPRKKSSGKSSRRSTIADDDDDEYDDDEDEEDEAPRPRRRKPSSPPPRKKAVKKPVKKTRSMSRR